MNQYLVNDHPDRLLHNDYEILLRDGTRTGHYYKYRKGKKLERDQTEDERDVTISSHY